VAEVNEALAGKPALANEDPYGAGWLAVLKPTNWGEVKASLTPGAQVAPKYEAKMAADGFAGCGCAP
jgi:glycine cleavage system H protein